MTSLRSLFSCCRAIVSFVLQAHDGRWLSMSLAGSSMFMVRASMSLAEASKFLLYPSKSLLKVSYFLAEVAIYLGWLSDCRVEVSKILPRVSECLNYLSKCVAGLSMLEKRVTTFEIKNPALLPDAGFFVRNYVVAGTSSSLLLGAPIFLTTLLKVNCSFFSGSSLYIFDAILHIPITSS